MKTMKSICFICHGNICRSTMAQSIMSHLINQQNLNEHFHINSAATSREEIGNPPHHGTVAKLREVGIPVIPHRATQITKQDYDKYDYLIVMDEANIRNTLRIIGSDPEGKIHKLLQFADNNRQGCDVADPWWTGDFDATYNDVLVGCEGLLAYLLKKGI